MSIAGIALANELNANLARKWIGKRASSAPVPARLLPVRIEPQLPAAPCEVGLIEVQVPGARIQLHGDVDAKRLRVVLAALAAQA